MKFKHAFLVGVALLLMQLACFAQEIERKHKSLSGFEMSLGTGYTQIVPSSFNSINTALSTKGYAPAANDLIMENLSMIHLFTHNFYFGLDLNFCNKRNNSMDSSRTTSSGFFTGFKSGYVVFQGKRCVFYPALGIDIGKIDIHSHMQTSMNSINDVSASNNFYSIGASLNWDLVPGKIPERNSLFTDTQSHAKYFSGVIRISVGAVYSPVKTFWNDNNIDVYNKISNNVNFKTDVIGVNNNAGISMMYIKLQYGFGVLFHKM